MKGGSGASSPRQASGFPHHNIYDPNWAARLDLKEERDYQEGCFDLMFTDELGNILIDDTVDVSRMSNVRIKALMLRELERAEALLREGLSDDKGCIRALG